MATQTEVLSALDNCYENPHWSFITLSHPYIYLIDSRINIFRDNSGNWAVAAEVLGYNPRGWSITLEIFYFGNCLVNLESYSDGGLVNNYQLSPIDDESFDFTVEDEILLQGARFWTVRGQQVPLSQNKQDYENEGIELMELERGGIRVEEAARFAIIKHADAFRATDEELYKSIPPDLEKISVLDEWFHKEYFMHTLTKSYLAELTSPDSDPQGFIKNSMQQQIDLQRQSNQEAWNNNRPGSYETWQQLANVIATGDISLYKPTLEPNSHWKNWPESGAL